jgi:Metal-dependent hydrolases of the beta-lactamase superfamily I
MRMMSIASGSSGNCTFVSVGDSVLLVDTGISLKRIEEGLNKAEHTGKDIDGVLITHEHNDHIKGLGVLLRKYDIPVYATEGTINGIAACRNMGKYDRSLFQEIGRNDIFSVGDIEVRVHPISHDAREPVCFSFHEGSRKAVVATDMGCFDDDLMSFLSNSDAMLIEANHDIHMLEVGPYPYELKRRILGDRGHLSNDSSGRLIKRLLNNHIMSIMLAHLSKENNFEELAYETVKCEIQDNPFTDDVRDFNLSVAKRDEPGDIIEI